MDTQNFSDDETEKGARLPPLVIASVVLAALSLALIILNFLGITVIQTEYVIVISLFAAFGTAIAGTVCAAISLKKYGAIKLAKILAIVALAVSIICLLAAVALSFIDLIVLVAIGLGKGV